MASMVAASPGCLLDVFILARASAKGIVDQWMSSAVLCWRWINSTAGQDVYSLRTSYTGPMREWAS
jgi:hypothetical protein